MNSRACFWPTLLLSLLAAHPAAGQAETQTVDEIQVTATRRPATADEVSAALTIISSEEIAGSKLTTDALQSQPGVYLQQTTPGQGAAIIRGLKGSEILHLVDGFRLNNAIFRNAPTQYLALVSPGAVERIEVVRGAQASLYGSDAVGGVVQVLSRVPSFEGDEVQTRGDVFAAFDTAESGKVIRGSYDIGNENVAGLVSAEYSSIGDRRVGGGETIAPSAYDAKGGRVALSITPESGNDWLMDLQFARQPSTPRVDELVPGYGQTEPSSSEFFFAPNERYFAHLRHSRPDSIAGADFLIDAGWQRIVDDRITRNYESPERRYEENQSDLYGLTSSLSDTTQNGSWIVGVEFYHDVVSSRRLQEDLQTGEQQLVQSRFPDGSTVDQSAAYGNLQWHTGDRHTLSGGARYSYVAIELPLAGSESSRTTLDDVSADLGYLFDLNDQTALTANLGHGFRAPNVFDMGTLGERPGNRFNIPNPNLSAEHVTQIDVGLRQRSDTWSMDVSLYGLRFSDRITSVLTGAITPDGRDVVQSRNIKSADIVGVEASIHWLISDAFTADVVVNFTRGEQSEANEIIVPADRIPPLNGRIALRYEPNELWYIEPYLLYTGEQDRLSPRDVRDVRINPDGTPGWGTLNVRAQWSPRDNFQIGLLLENLSDKNYRVHGSGIDGTGRNLGLSARLSW
jgi:hemoglobin/transferrin/lactoferrin receptor protein